MESQMLRGEYDEIIYNIMEGVKNVDVTENVCDIYKFLILRFLVKTYS